MEVIITKNYKEMSAKAFEIFQETVKNKPQYRVGYATGSTPIGLYQKMVESYQNGENSYKNMNAYNLDEYIGLDKDNDQSYYHFLHEHLFNQVDVKKENIDIISHSDNTIEEECDRYSTILESNPLDVQILGLGSNGHIGFNEPGSTKDTTTRIVELDEKTRKDNARMFSSIEEVPTKAITVGIKDILHAKHIILLASGKNKADAVKAMLEGPVDSGCPASYLQLHNNVSIVLDETAAEHIKQ